MARAGGSGGDKLVGEGGDDRVLTTWWMIDAVAKRKTLFDDRPVEISVSSTLETRAHTALPYTTACLASSHADH